MPWRSLRAEATRQRSSSTPSVRGRARSEIQPLLLAHQLDVPDKLQHAVLHRPLSPARVHVGPDGCILRFKQLPKCDGSLWTIFDQSIDGRSQFSKRTRYRLQTLWQVTIFEPFQHPFFHPILLSNVRSDRRVAALGGALPLESAQERLRALLSFYCIPPMATLRKLRYHQLGFLPAAPPLERLPRHPVVRHQGFQLGSTICAMSQLRGQSRQVLHLVPRVVTPQGRQRQAHTPCDIPTRVHRIRLGQTSVTPQHTL